MPKQYWVFYGRYFNQLIQIVIFTIIFGKVAKIPTEGIPYVLFSSVAIIPWTYMSQSMTESSQSLVKGQHMLGKIYFPRLIFPLISVFSKLIDFGISMLIIVAVAIYYHVLPTWNLLLFPVFVIFMISISAGIGIVVVSYGYPISRCKTCHAFCNSYADVYSTHCLFSIIYTGKISHYLFYESGCRSY